MRPTRAAATSPLSYTFSPDGRYLAVTLGNGAVRLWDIESRQELFDWRPDFFSGREPVAFTADSNKLAVADSAGPVLHLLDLETLNDELAELGLGW